MHARRDNQLGEWIEIAADDQPIALEVNALRLECQIECPVRFEFSNAERTLMPVSMRKDPRFGR